jgi:hypothetical protein
VNVAPWGKRVSEDDGRVVGLEWAEPRDIHRVVVTFAEAVPEPRSVRLQWWQSGWPARGTGQKAMEPMATIVAGPPPTARDQGAWHDADTYVQATGRGWTFTFRHLNLAEFPQLSDVTAEHRTTSRIRVRFPDPAPAISSIEAYTDSQWHVRPLRLPWSTVESRLRPKLSVFNGSIATVTEGDASDDTVALWLAQSSRSNSPDATSVNVESARLTYRFEPAAGGTEPAGRMWFPLDAQAGGRRFVVNVDGTVSRVAGASGSSAEPESARHFDFAFGLPAGGPIRRWVEDDCLPIMNSEWELDGIRYTQTVLLTSLSPEDPRTQSPETNAKAVLMVRIVGKNIAQEYRLARAVLSVVAADRPVPVVLRDGWLLAEPDNASGAVPATTGARVGEVNGESLLAAVEVQGAAQGTQENGKVHLAGNMPPGTDGFMVLRIPMVPPVHADDLERLRNLEFDAELRRAKRFWREPTDRR